ncbi:hypothetical protein Cgig2_021680 [Carnegiea gigantea]|uniref:Uncharacterized protein n=1 Tax=Carnegiea gigantea TaxID=171969 RepID=A0A9Q1KQX7_9CARY|nr:hypothetical protein Cgig2_021680 [Carnegiea gigantea]
MSCFWPWCMFFCFAWHYAQPVAPHHPQHSPLSDVYRWRRQAGCSGQCRGKPRVMEDGHAMYQAKRSSSDESGALNGETAKGYKLEVAQSKFQKRASSRPSKQREEPQKRWFRNGFRKRISHQYLMRRVKHWRTIHSWHLPIRKLPRITRIATNKLFEKVVADVLVAVAKGGRRPPVVVVAAHDCSMARFQEGLKGEDGCLWSFFKWFSARGSGARAAVMVDEKKAGGEEAW